METTGASGGAFGFTPNGRARALCRFGVSKRGTAKEAVLVAAADLVFDSEYY